MKKLIITIVMFISMTVNSQPVKFPGIIDQPNTNYVLEDVSFTITPFGVIDGKMYITVTSIDSGEGTIWSSWEYNSDGNKEEFSSFTFKKNVRTKINFTFSGASPGVNYPYFAIKTLLGGCGTGLKGNLFNTALTTPAIREMIVKNVIDTSYASYMINSTTESSNIDDIVLYEIKDLGGKVLDKIKDTIPGTVDAVTKTRSIFIDFVKYPTATTLVTQAQTNNKQTLKLKNTTTSSVVSPSITIKGLTDDTKIQIFNTLGQYIGTTTWGEEQNMSRDVFYKSETMTKPKRKPVVVF